VIFHGKRKSRATQFYAGKFRSIRRSGPPAATSGRCLDAAHGNGDRPERQRTAVRRAHLRRIEPQGTRDTHRSGKRRRGPPTTAHADAAQGSRRADAVARSRRKRAITKRNAAKDAEQWFTAIDVASFFGSFEPCGPQPCPAEARKHPAVAGRAPRLRPNPKPFVILNEVDRRTQREQRPLADYAEQGGERQTKCSQESILGKVADSSSADGLLRMTNY